MAISFGNIEMSELCRMLDEDEEDMRFWTWFLQDQEEAFLRMDRSIETEAEAEDKDKENPIDLDAKETLRLEGHQRYPQFHGCTMQRGNKAAQPWDWTLRRDYRRPISKCGEWLSVTALDQVGLGWSGHNEVTLSSRDQWAEIPDLLLSQGRLMKLEQHIKINELEAFFQMPILGEIRIRDDDDDNASGGPFPHKKQKDWFRWGSRYYNPEFLYTMKHGKELTFQVWSQNQRPQIPAPNQSLQWKRGDGNGGVTEFVWKQPHSIRWMVCEGEQPKTMIFPNEYYRWRNPRGPTKRARQKRTRGKCLQIVTNPHEVGFVSSFRLSYFHIQTRRWLQLGIFAGNTSAKSAVAIDLTEHEIVTRRFRVEPIETHNSGQFWVQMLGEKKKTEPDKPEETAIAGSVLYELFPPEPPSLRGWTFSRGSRHWRWYKTDQAILKRGKTAQRRFYNARHDFSVAT